MKIVTLMENTACHGGLACEHGLSLYIETEKHRILFDAGQTEAFADNAEKLGIDLAKVDIAVLSHGHYDHGGGLKRFLEINSSAPIYVGRDAFRPYFNGTGKYIGLEPSLLESKRLIFVEDSLQIAEGVTLYSCNDRLRPFPADSFGLTVQKDGEFFPDDFRHEQYLLIAENGRQFCFSGCSHKGILNIVQWFQPDVLVGGFHFMKLDPNGPDAGLLTEAAAQLLRQPTVYYTGHCTGAAPFAFLKRRMGSHLNALSAGSVIIL